MKDKIEFINDDEFAEMVHQKEMEDRWQEEEERELPVININTLEPSEATSEDLAAVMISKLLEGFINPLEFAVKKKCIEQALELTMENKQVKDLMIEEKNKHGKINPVVLGATISIRSFPKYKYEADPKWKEIKAAMAPLETELEKQQELVRMATKTNTAQVNEETGEILARPVPAPGPTSICVSFKKK